MTQRVAIALLGLALAVIRPEAQPVLPLVFPRPGAMVSMGAPINSDYQEHSPVLSPDGRALFFARRDHPQNIGVANADDIWVSYRQADGSWSRAINAGAPLNDWLPNAPVALTQGGNRLYLTRLPPAADTLGQDARLFVANREGRSWTSPQPVPIPGYRNTHPDSYFTLATDEHVLLFSAEGSAAARTRDLFICFRKRDGSWAEPVPLGPDINTSGDERGVVLAADERTLYFSSDGHPGRGGTDIFVSRRLDDSWTRWSTPVNLGAAVNTSGDDDQFALSAAGNTIVLARVTTAGPADIYRAALSQALRPLPVVLLQGRLTGAGPASRLYCQRLDQTQAGPEAVALRNDGSFRFFVPATTPAVCISAICENGFAVSQCIPLAGALPGAPDADATPVLEILRTDAAYQQRDTDIRALLRQLREGETLLDNLTREIETPVRIPEELLAQVPNLPAITAVEAAYSPFFSRSRPDSSQQAAFPSSETDTVAPPADTPASFTRAVWSHLLTGMLPQARYELERQLLRENAEAVRQNKRPDAFRQAFLEERMEVLPPPPPDTAADAWLTHEGWPCEMEAALRSGLQNPALEALATILRPALQARLDAGLRRHRRQIHQNNLRETLEMKLQQQMEAERAAGVSITTVPIPAAPGLPVPEPEAGSFREIQVEVPVLPVDVSREVCLHAIFFSENSAELLPASAVELERLAEALRQHPELGIEINAHTHGGVCHSLARQLTEARARAVADALVAYGIARERLVARGIGKLAPLTTDTGEEGARQNQRIEIRWFNL